jgi:excinuclease ABC A subunit
MSVGTERRSPAGFFEIKNARANNLKNISCAVPLGVLCVLTGVSGSGKSSLLLDEFAVKNREKVVVIDQKPLSGMARGNSATYIGIFGKIRELFAKENGVSKGIFPFNGQGACPECKGLGYRKIDMHFMGDVTVQCETCFGKRYKSEVLQYLHNGKSIDAVLSMTLAEAYSFFNDSSIKQRIGMLIKVGLGYLQLGQSHDTISGGEAQRLKLASQLHKKGEIYILDEPTSGLHFDDIKNLLKLLNELVDNGNTVLAIEHSMHFIRNADYIIDIGPGGGKNGGEVVVEGTPEEVAKSKNSLTGRYL